MSVWNFIKDKARSADDKALIKAGFLNDCGDLQCAGKDALTAILFEANKKALVDLAVEMNAKADEESKK